MKMTNEDIIKSSIKEYLNEDKKAVTINDISGYSNYPNKGRKLNSNKYFIIHHTAGRGTARDVVRVLNSRKLGVQWVIDREGKIYQTLPMGGRGAHVATSDNYKNAPKGINNSNSQGVEVIASNDGDILEVQAISALKLIKYLGFSPSQIYGHGEVNPGHKQASEGRTIKNFIKTNWNKLPEDYDFKLISIAPSNIKPVEPSNSKEYMEYILSANKIYNPTKTWINTIGDTGLKWKGKDNIYGVKRIRDNRVYLFRFDPSLNLYYIEMPFNGWNDKTSRENIINNDWNKLTKNSVIKNQKTFTPSVSTNGNVDSNSKPSTEGMVNIVIGDSQTPYVDMNTSKTQRISKTGGKSSLWLGGMGVNWLRDAVKEYPVTKNVKNVVVCIGTNGGFGKFLNDDINGLFTAINKTFPNAKIYVVQGSWGWGGLKNITEKDVRDYYNKYKSLGATLIEPPIGKTDNPHGNLPIYKQIGSSIDSQIS